MRTTLLWTALASAGLLAACGGGSDASAPNSGIKLDVDGTASKGLLDNADVLIYAVGADGKIGNTPLTSGTTGTDGKYSLNFNATTGQPYVVQVKAKTDGSTTHLDEVSGVQQKLSKEFQMRTLLVPTGSGSVSASITPFSEMAVAAAEKASCGITPDNARQARSVVTQLLGFDPTIVTPVPVKDAATPEQQTLAVMLTAVSQLAADAADGKLGCADASDKTRCVVEKLAGGASTDSLRLKSGTLDLSAALSTATQTVRQRPDLIGSIPSTAVSNVIANLGCEADACKPATGGGTAAANTTAGKIQSAKDLLTQIQTDLKLLFSQGTDGKIALEQEGLKFQSAMDSIQDPIEMAGKDVGVLLRGVELYQDYISGRTTYPHRNEGFSYWGYNGIRYGATRGLAGLQPGIAYDMRCSLYQDSTNQTVATSPSNAKSIGCSASYYAYGTTGIYLNSPSTTTEWRHGFTITPNTDGSSYSYTSRARKRVQNCTIDNVCTTMENVALQPQTDPFAGTLNPVMSDNKVGSFTLKGELPAAFKSGLSYTALNSGGNQLANFKHAIDLTGSQTLKGSTVTAMSLRGSIVGYKDANTPESKLELKSGSIDQASGADFNVVWNTGAAEFEGSLGMQNLTKDKSGTENVPTQLTLAGALRNLVNGASTEFLSGKLKVSVPDYANFDSTQPRSASNKYTANFDFTGAVSAANRPKLELTLAGGAINDGNGTPLPLTLQYRTLIANQPRTSVMLSGTPRSSTTLASFKLSEATTGLSMSLAEKATQADIVYGTPPVTIGTLKQDGVLTFIDGSFMSFGL